HALSLHDALPICSPARATFHTPYSWLWLYSVQPWSKCVSSALPRGSIARMRRPCRPASNGFSAGKANQVDVNGAPATAAARRSAARRISGPSGTASDGGHAPAVHRQAHAVDVGARGRAEEGDDAAGFLGRGEAARRDRGLHLAPDLVLAAILAGGAVAD